MNSASKNSRTSVTNRHPLRSSLIALAALGIPAGALLAPGVASASPADPGNLPVDIVLPIDILFPGPPQPFTPVPFPNFDPVPIPLPGPDDGPLPILPEVPEIPDFDPMLPDDILVFPTDPIDPGDGPVDEAPTCNDFAAEDFSVAVNRYNADLIELRLTNTDVDVCDINVWTGVAVSSAAVPFSETNVGMETIAFATDSAGYYQQTFPDMDLCELAIFVEVEGAAMMDPIIFSEGGCDEPEDAPVPTDDGTPDDGGETPTDDGTPDDGGETPTDDGTPDDGGETPTDDGTPEEDRPLIADEEPRTPGTPSGGLPSTGTNSTTLILAIGFLTLGAGSIVALATRGKDQLPAV